MDIGNSKYVRPDVYHFVNENIGRFPVYREKDAPEHEFEPSKSGQGIEIVSSGPSAAKAAKAKKAALAQMRGDAEAEADAEAGAEGDAKAEGKGKKEAKPVGDPEKVNVLQPLDYQQRANTNTPNIRTTFYAQ